MEASALPAAPDFGTPSLIGGRLREQRQRKGLTVRDLATRVGVSPSLISQIERDKVKPSVSTLWGLVTVLGIPISELFPDTDTASGIQQASRPAHDGPVTTPANRAVINLEGGVRWERLTADTDSLVEFLSVEYSPGAASCEEDSLVRHGGKEYGYILSGRLGVRIGFDEHELGPGMAISFDSSSPHRLWTIGTQPVQAIWVVVGRQSDNRGPRI